MLIFAKILITFLTVVLLAKVAERLGPKYAGLLSGFPLGTGIALYFFGWQQSPEFAADAAIYTLSGLSSAIVLSWGYWQVIRRFPKSKPLPLAVIMAVTVSLACFMCWSMMLQYLPPSRVTGVLIVIAAILLFRRLFRTIKDQDASVQGSSAPRISHYLNNRWTGLFARANLATLTILMITGLADALGPDRAGLLAAFPVSFFPLMLLLHLTKGADVLASTIKHYPDGIGSLATYCLAVSYLYPVLGLHLGTFVSLMLACGYLGVYWALGRRNRVS